MKNDFMKYHNIKYFIIHKIYQNTWTFLGLVILIFCRTIYDIFKSLKIVCS